VENLSIKTVSEVFLNRFIYNVNYLPWPDPTADHPTADPAHGCPHGCKSLRLARWVKINEIKIDYHPLYQLGILNYFSNFHNLVLFSHI